MVRHSEVVELNGVQLTDVTANLRPRSSIACDSSARCGSHVTYKGPEFRPMKKSHGVSYGSLPGIGFDERLTS
ncbi:hypothetical protein RSOLAG1IB_07235 [Rhizoctonia solani AG-1 IB]|uniref:Uncharacterized protein n=1 Tax=Thanatephorus cucumeris (strain AG1-IB / isolate 7/3/14) TaxID=1108050 RepID=A0A0B7F9G3_THACB|nr:hypothetical protein RSOLAG1IB_07235 [Rhizoctonia solani AG-1 IB]